MSRDSIALGVGAFATVLAFTLIGLNYRGEGRVVASLSSGHGLHEGDLVILVVWVLVLALVRLAWRGFGRRER